MDKNTFSVDTTKKASSKPIIIEVVNSALPNEGFNRLELVVTANIDADINVDISDNNINFIEYHIFNMDEDIVEISYDLMIQKETPLAQFKLLVDGKAHPVIIKNVQ